MFEYNCPNCDNKLEGTFGEDVYCDKCHKTFETEWDYVGESLVSWITTEKENQ